MRKTNSSGVKATIKIVKHTVPNNKINMATHNYRTKKRRKKKEKERKTRCENKQKMDH